MLPLSCASYTQSGKSENHVAPAPTVFDKRPPTACPLSVMGIMAEILTVPLAAIILTIPELPFHPRG